MTNEHLRELISLAKDMGVKSLKVGDFEVELHPPAARIEEIDPRLLGDQILRKETEEDVLFWAVGGSGRQDTNGKAVVPPLVGEDDAS